ncbi:hypothetical protein PR048_009361 [Dryococelus australis]|uniref:Uncharacterized protein n=1 Tax=Dryococelus australis TaxID=614101 RepID=A0ABQ9HZN3_9NEOP|nr:hypothetical protein PR048_009361 [Dryococelus australis]
MENTHSKCTSLAAEPHCQDNDKGSMSLVVAGGQTSTEAVTMEIYRPPRVAMFTRTPPITPSRHQPLTDPGLSCHGDHPGTVSHGRCRFTSAPQQPKMQMGPAVMK